ncbi:hypothetical protein K470DRAFT_226062 [Piedraia hortae CBS 480.64]|uniref:INSIG-domain-containing protein n=1 Tax=Piedraia hortae CBS 480.64 TaxID=1314780 RepID=A0A6A7C8H0_9PEZI|nr:hypothetical protein K470DRAFT_226062 [Piedraia hortae CBS 480.64]
MAISSRMFELSSAPSSAPSTPTNDRSTVDGGGTPYKTQSFLNLTGSTLSGIYQPTEDNTPFGTGAQTPTTVRKPDRRYTRKRTRGYLLLSLVARVAVLVAVGLLYGFLIGQLHPSGTGGPPTVLWAGCAVLMGLALPRLDAETEEADTKDWLHAVRSVSAFVGVAFAIRRLPWESTMQLSLTLALANPAIWYLIDRTISGFGLAAGNAVAVTGVCLLVRPGFVVPREMEVGRVLFGLASQEKVAAITWFASAAFVGTICWGNVGRRLEAALR